MRDGPILRLSAGGLRAVLHPGIGGSIGGFWSETPDGRVDWLRPATPDAVQSADVLGMACYPLLPFSNRVRDGRFTFAGEDIALPLNFLPDPHVIHGHGWTAPWTVVEANAATARLEFLYDGSVWPWAYRAEQAFQLTDTGLTVSIALTNTAPTPMPAGIGLHPFFPRQPGTTIFAAVKALWLTDDEVMPTALVPASTVWPTGEGLGVEDAVLDTCFTGWDGAIDIRWPDRSLRMTADGPLDKLVIFTPQGETFFCAEPVSNITDALNLVATRDDTGLVTLAPGETLSGTVRFNPGL